MVEFTYQSTTFPTLEWLVSYIFSDSFLLVIRSHFIDQR